MDSDSDRFVAASDIANLISRWKIFEAGWKRDADEWKRDYSPSDELARLSAERCEARESIYRVCISDLTHLLNHSLKLTPTDVI